jgi:hypothetical protein
VPLALGGEQVFDDGMALDRRHRLEVLRRSLAMLTPRQPALDREEALELLAELEEVDRRLRELRAGLRALLDEGPA